MEIKNIRNVKLYYMPWLLKKLKLYHLMPWYLGRGCEGTVFRTKDQKAYKQYTHLGYHEYLSSKYKKLHLLDGIQILGYCMPDNIVVDQKDIFGIYCFEKISNEIIGYEMPLLVSTFHMNDLSLEDRIHILLEIVTRLEDGEKYDIYNLDISHRNIIIDHNKVPFFIDVDNFYVCGIPPETYPPKTKYCLRHYTPQYFPLKRVVGPCFLIYVLETLTRHEINFKTERNDMEIAEEIKILTKQVLEKFSLPPELVGQWQALFSKNTVKECITIEEIKLFLIAFKDYLPSVHYHGLQKIRKK